MSSKSNGFNELNLDPGLGEKEVGRKEGHRVEGGSGT